MPALGTDKIMAVLKRYAVTTTGGTPHINFKLSIQTADVRTDKPDAWTDLGSAYQDGGEDNTDVIDVSATTVGKMWYRLGVAYYLSGGTPSSGDAELELTTASVSCGTVLGTRTSDLVTFNTTVDAFTAVTDWALVTDSDKVCAGFTLSAVQGNFQCKLVYRTASTSTQIPGAWTAISGLSTYLNANGESSTGEKTLTLGATMYVQFGLAYSQSSSGSTPGAATVTTTVAVRRT